MIGFTIFLVLVVVLSLITTGICIKHYNKIINDADYNEYTKNEARGVIKKVKKIRFFVPTGCIAVFLVSMILGGIFIIDQTEIGVVKTFGQISRNITTGLNLVNPLTDTVIKIDLKVHKQERAFASYTKDAQPITASVEFQTEVVPSRADEVIASYGSQEAMEEKLGNLVEERTKIVLAKYSAMPLLENRANLSAEVTAEVEKLEEQFPVNFTTVIVRDIDFSDAFEASVEAKMTAEQAALKAEQDKKTAVIKAEQEKEVAAIKAEAAIAQAKGEAEALNITQQALRNMPDTWIQQLYLEKWDGKLPTFMSDNNAGIFLNPDINS